MKIKTRELTGIQLDYAVLIAQGYTFSDWHTNDGDPQVWVELVDAEGRGPAGYFPGDERFRFSSVWSPSGPIIDRERITLRVSTMPGTDWAAFYDVPGQYHAHVRERGPTALIAAMRCYVASKLGDIVDIPEELL